MSNIILNLQLTCKNIKQLPTKSMFIHWLQAVFIKLNNIEVTIRLVDPLESKNLNMKYRGQNYPTNILSFPFQSPHKMKIILLGDLVICPKIIEYESYNQNKKNEYHWAHIIIHGALHLLGYDHKSYKQFKKMNNMEIKIMNKLGYFNFNN